MNDDDLCDPFLPADHSVLYTHSTTHGVKRVDHLVHLRPLHTHIQGEQKGGGAQRRGEEAQRTQSGTGLREGLYTHIGSDWLR